MAATGGRAITERFSQLPLRWRIGAFVLLGLAGIFTLFGLLGAELAQEGRQRTIKQWSGLTISTARFIDSELESQFDELAAVAERLRRAQADAPMRVQALADGFTPPRGFVAGRFVMGAGGATTWSDGAAADASETFVLADSGVRDLLVSGSRYASAVRSLGGHGAVILAVPVLAADGQPVGVLGSVIRPESWIVADLVAGARGLAATGHAELIDQAGNVIVSSEPGHVLKPGEHPDIYGPDLRDHRGSVGLTAPVGPVDPSDQGQRHVMAFVPLQSAPWGLALGGAEDELIADANRWQQQIVLFGGLTIVLALLLVWVTTRSVARPIRSLTAASRSIATGDLSTPVPHEGEGEILELAEAFDHMRSALQAALSSLAVEESRYEGIVASMADAVITTDKDLRITALNPAAVRLTGARAADVSGRRSCEVICSRGRRTAECAESCALLSPSFELGMTKDTIRGPGGGLVTLAITRSAIRDDEGQLAGVVHVMRDISAEEEVDRLKDEFLSTVSHELRTPLGFIMGYGTTLLLPDAPDDRTETRRLVQVMVDASKELQELVDNLLDMTKIGAGSLSVVPGEVRLDRLVRSAVERIRIRGHGHRFATSMDRSLPPVNADAHRIEQVLYNLLDNAIKYSPDGGDVHVRAAVSGGEVVVSVVDEGFGIPADELGGLFERFHRGKAACSRGIGGTGLGLAICRGIVVAHGGRIWAESPATDHRSGPPRGTAIRFTVPLAPAKSSARHRAGAAKVA